VKFGDSVKVFTKEALTHSDGLPEDQVARQKTGKSEVLLALLRK